MVSAWFSNDAKCRRNFQSVRQSAEPNNDEAVYLMYYIPHARFAVSQQDAKDAAAALVDVQEKVASVELDNRRLVEEVSPVDGAQPAC